MRFLTELKEKASPRTSYDEQTSDYLRGALCTLRFLATWVPKVNVEKRFHDRGRDQPIAIAINECALDLNSGYQILLSANLMDRTEAV